MRKRALVALILLWLLIFCSLLKAEQRYERYSPIHHTKFTLVVMDWSEFDAFILEKTKYNNVKHRLTDGYHIAGLTYVVRRLCTPIGIVLGRCNTLGEDYPTAWTVYLPVNQLGYYDQESYDHELYYHVDNDIHHFVPKD